MSSQWVDRKVQCGNDCRQKGCPKHTLRLHYHHTSDTVGVLMDGRNYTTFDSAIWRALVNMDAELRDRSDFGCDREQLKTLRAQAKAFNDAICEQEGYNPVGEDWIERELLIAFMAGKESKP